MRSVSISVTVFLHHPGRLHVKILHDNISCNLWSSLLFPEPEQGISRSEVEFVL